MPPHSITAKKLLQQPLPDLEQGQYHTLNSALHNIEFIGTLTPWPNFEVEVQTTFEEWFSEPRSHASLSYEGSRPGPSSLSNEHYVVGKEEGVQGRYQNNVGQAMGAILQNQAVDIQVGDFAASATIYHKEPDMAFMSRSTKHVRIVSEFKTPWIDAHNLAASFSGADGTVPPSKQLGQIAEYMYDLHLKYGFMSTYEETVFLRQVQDATSVWVLQHSPIIRHSANGTIKGEVSVRQCIWHLCQSAVVEHRTTLRHDKLQWVQ
ncbi:hypothetical protein FE257_001037 [Aspergillus nanangensis]|uniref:Uncharacterized protein n=1 Tax=Aspergillus nanangensis TaxID=2582783 RepID=A0AAD4CTX0_ASPNN|nr:hypothetical protein FE257_001037 [Aspergillus nanangensis]